MGGQDKTFPKERIPDPRTSGHPETWDAGVNVGLTERMACRPREVWSVPDEQSSFWTRTEAICGPPQNVLLSSCAHLDDMDKTTYLGGAVIAE